ncbi:tetratricopeptide repeat protein [Oceanimonas pelagia]|uniref:Tetratricopeptide repeat protein n=1 Tax=Oceanimonas pelagia TaxID=3028314 RepID=A0AA50KL98_9GAMM|nr:tetratricopeptide repeat protein [Oceanimonas pelagia]WMC09629.1 tetratricopeptide repeat protein [Oceanimonas pelagia]
MDIYSTEEQQIEAIKRWWHEYGKAIILGSALGLAGLFGWRYYQSEQLESRAAGAEAFEQISRELASGGSAAFDRAAAFVSENQGNSYGELAALLLAAEAVKANDLALAQQQLEQALAGTSDAALANTVRLRLARVLIAGNELDAAQGRLDEVTGDAFAAQKHEIQGDLFLARQQPAEARAAYEAARSAGGVGENPALTLKLDHLAAAAAQGEQP